MTKFKYVLAALAGIIALFFRIIFIIYNGDYNYKIWHYDLFLLLYVWFSNYIVWLEWNSVKTLRISAQNGNVQDMCDLSGKLMDFNKTEAHHWALKAEGQGSRRGAFLLGYILYGEGNYEIAFMHFMRAAEKDYEPAYRAIADCYKTGNGVLANDRLALEWRIKSASVAEDTFMLDNDSEPNIAPPPVRSRFIVGMAYIKGEGCNINLVEGYAWLIIASNSKHTGALKMTKLLNREGNNDLKRRAQDRALEISECIAKGIPITNKPDESNTHPLNGNDKNSEIPAWRTFLTVILTSNLFFTILLLGSPNSILRKNPIVHGALFFGFLISAIFISTVCRNKSIVWKTSITLSSFFVSSALITYLNSPEYVTLVIGAGIPSAAFVFIPSFILINWKHLVSDIIFYILITIHVVGLSLWLTKI